MVARRMLPAVAGVVVLVGCGGGPAGQAAAQDACRSYADTLRHQVATTAARAEAIRSTASAAARRAAAADDTWRTLERDIADFYARQRTLAQTSSAAEVNGYFAADRRVQADCRAAGTDIGPLRP